MVTDKRKRTDLSVPSWLKDEFQKGSKQKEQMAEILQQVNWSKDPLQTSTSQQPHSSHNLLFHPILNCCLFWSFQLQELFVDEMQRIITSRKKVSITRDQGWYSESEMRNDLKWSSYLGGSIWPFYLWWCHNVSVSTCHILLKYNIYTPAQAAHQWSKELLHCPGEICPVRQAGLPTVFLHTSLGSWRQEERLWWLGRVLGYCSWTRFAWRRTWSLGATEVQVQGRVDMSHMFPCQSNII